MKTFKLNLIKDLSYTNPQKSCTCLTVCLFINVLVFSLRSCLNCINHANIFNNI